MPDAVTHAEEACGLFANLKLEKALGICRTLLAALKAN